MYTTDWNLRDPSNYSQALQEVTQSYLPVRPVSLVSIFEYIDASNLGK